MVKPDDLWFPGILLRMGGGTPLSVLYSSERRPVLQRQRIYACRSAVTICICRQSVDENSIGWRAFISEMIRRDVRVDGEGAVIALTENADC